MMRFDLGRSPKDYSDPQIFTTEMSAVFGRNWFCIGHESELSNAGDFKTFTIGNEPLILLRDHSQLIRAFFNICPHRGYPLAEARTGNCRELVCAYHGLRFDLNGSGLDDCLGELHTRVLSGFIFVSLGNLLETDCPPEEFENCLEKIPKFPLKSSQARPFVVEVDFNWKLYVENMVEGRHIASVHDGFESLIDSTYDYQEIGLASISKVALKAQVARGWSERHYQAALNAMPEDTKREFIFFFFYPNTLITVYPEQLLLLHVLPVSALKTAIHGSFISQVESSRATRLARYLNRRVGTRIHLEDNLLLAKIQKNLRSEFYPGNLRSDPVKDPELIHFHRHLNLQMNLYSETF